MDTQQITGLPRWTRAASFGFLFATVGFGLYLIAGLFWALGGAAFFGPFAFVGAVMTFLVRRFGTWSKILGIVFSLAFAFMFWWSAFGLLRPSAFFDFTSGVLILPGALIALGSCIASLVAKRRGHYSISAEGGERRTIRVAVAIACVLALVSGVATIASRSTAANAETASATAVAKNFKFEPTAYSVAGGSKLLVRNDDPFYHSFTIDALGIDVDLNPGSSVLVTIPAKAGTYVLYCAPHGDPTPKPDQSEDSMNGTLTVS